MTVTKIPGRRMTSGDSFYTDWGTRGGDSMLLRAEVIQLTGSGTKLTLEVQTRQEPGDTESVLSPSYPASPTVMTIDAASVGVAYYEAGSSSGLEREVRLKVTCTGGASGTDYVVARIFPPVFFDNAK